MNTYTTTNGRTSHYRKPGTTDTYCGRHNTTPGVGARMCRPCVKAEALDRAEAAAVAAEHTEQARPESPTREDLAETVICPTCRVGVGARCLTRAGKPAAHPHDRRYEALEQAAGITEHRAAVRRAAPAHGIVCIDRKAEQELLAAYADRIAAPAATAPDPVDADTRAAVETVTTADATDGTWRGHWIGQQDPNALFDLTPDAEQGALFDDRATAPTILGHAVQSPDGRIWECDSLDTAREVAAEFPHMTPAHRTAAGWITDGDPDAPIPYTLAQ